MDIKSTKAPLQWIGFPNCFSDHISLQKNPIQLTQNKRSLDPIIPISQTNIYMETDNQIIIAVAVIFNHQLNCGLEFEISKQTNSFSGSSAFHTHCCIQYMLFLVQHVLSRKTQQQQKFLGQSFQVKFLNIMLLVARKFQVTALVTLYTILGTTSILLGVLISFVSLLP